MNNKRRTWGLLAALVLIVGAGLEWQHHVAVGLRDEIEHERQIRRELAEQRSNAERRAATDAKAKAAEEIVKADREAIERLRSEIAQLRERAEMRARQSVSSRSVIATPKPSMLKQMLTAEQWENAGSATAPATLETVLWASAAGDIDALAGLLSIDPVVRVKVNAMMMTLPEKIRKDYSTPERLIALMTAVDVPLGAAQIYEPKVADLRGTVLVAALRDTESRYSRANVILRQEGDAWKLVVPAQAVEKYAAVLKGNAAK